jgi:hypothetical protein
MEITPVQTVAELLPPDKFFVHHELGGEQKVEGFESMIVAQIKFSNDVISSYVELDKIFMEEVKQYFESPIGKWVVENKTGAFRVLQEKDHVTLTTRYAIAVTFTKKKATYYRLKYK